MSKLDLKAIALEWAKSQLEDPELMDIMEFGSEVDLTAHEADTVIEHIRDLVVAPRADVPKAYGHRTVIEGRTPRVKHHRTQGLARSAFSAMGNRARTGRLEELHSDGIWHVVFENKPGSGLSSTDLPWRKGKR